MNVPCCWTREVGISVSTCSWLARSLWTELEPVGDFFLHRWFDKIQNLGAADSRAQTGIVCFILFIGCLILFFFSKWIHLKGPGFYLGLVFPCIVHIISNIFAANQKSELVNRKKCDHVAQTVTGESSPDASGTDLFILHEGTKVSVKSKLGDWNEIEMEDGNVGWMPSKDMEII